MSDSPNQPGAMPEPEEIRFVGSQGHELAGVLHRTPERAKGCVLLAHCFTCSKDLFTMTRLAKGLAENGYAALRFDFTGRGESGGDFKTKTVSGNVSDIVRAATALIEMGFGPCALIGHSLGGAASVLAAHKLKTVTSLITIGAPSDVEHIRHLLSDDGSEVRIGERRFDLCPTFLEDLENHDVLEAAAELNRPYLVVHSRDDDVVEFENGEALFAAAKEPKQLFALETGGHLLAKRSAADEAFVPILGWLNASN